jgi:sterol desaturase/sphingolipid hydroxylase (fatty acid hydroxylase superfamily)
VKAEEGVVRGKDIAGDEAALGVSMCVSEQTAIDLARIVPLSDGIHIPRLGDGSIHFQSRRRPTVEWQLVQRVLTSGSMTMSLGTILLVVLLLILVGVIPTWPHSRGWGYAPGGVIGTILIIVLILFLLGRI